MSGGPSNLYDNIFYRRGFSAARFEKMCQQLFMAETPSFYVLDHSLGDRGLDGLDPDSGSYYAVYYPERPRDDSLYEKLRDKLSSDLAKVTRLSEDGELHVKRWVFVLPFDPDKRLLEHAARVGKRAHIPVVLFGQTKLEQLLLKYSHVKEEYFGDYGEITDLAGEIIRAGSSDTLDADLVHGLLTTAETNISEKVESQKAYLLRKNLNLYLEAVRILAARCEKGGVVLEPLLQHVEAFLIHLLVQTNTEPVLFAIINEEVLQTHRDLALAAGKKILPGIVTKSRAYADVTLTVNSIDGIGYLQRKNYTWWLVSALYLLTSDFHDRQVEVAHMMQLEHFRALLNQRIGARAVYEANRDAILDIASSKRPDLSPYLRRAQELIEEIASAEVEVPDGRAPFAGPS